MNSDTPSTIPLPIFKPQQKVVVVKGDCIGRHGIVVATATTLEMSAVSVRFKDGETAHWFLSDHIEKTTL